MYKSRDLYHHIPSFDLTQWSQSTFDQNFVETVMLKINVNKIVLYLLHQVTQMEHTSNPIPYHMHMTLQTLPFNSTLFLRMSQVKKFHPSSFIKHIIKNVKTDRCYQSLVSHIHLILTKKSLTKVESASFQYRVHLSTIM
jgi:hypothetical protein